MLHLLTAYFWPIAGATLVLIVLLAVWVGRLISAARKSPAKADKQEPPADGETQGADDSAHDPQLRASFLKGFDQLRNQTSGKDFRYRIPWFLLLGQVGSRPKDLLANAGLSFALSRPDHGDLASELGVRWWFFNGGLVLDLAGEYMLRSDGEGSDEAGWRSFLRLLQRYRPERPMDGVVLTVSAGELLEASKSGAQGAVEIEQKATVLSRKLWDLQKILGIRFPVYLLITGCEQVRGFSNFTKSLPEDTQQGIFGWSSPYSVDTVYRTEWADEAFDDLKSQLERRRLRIFAQGPGLDDADEVFIFSSEAQKLRGAVKSYLNQLFRAAYHESMLLRGVYFCGSATSEPTEPTLESIAQDEPNPVEMPEFLQGPGKAYHFVRDLFEKKIFVEANLARPTGASLLQKNRRVRAAQLGLAATIVLLTVGLWFGAGRLEQRKVELASFLENTRKRVAEAQQMRALYQTDAFRSRQAAIAGSLMPTDERETLKTSATRFLNELAVLNGKPYNSFFVPRSWWPDFDDDLKRALVRAYDVIVFRAMREELVYRAELAVSQRQYETDSGIGVGLVLPTDSSVVLVRPIDELREFGALERYLETLNELELYIERYNEIDATLSLDDLASLADFLFGEPLLPGFFTNPHVYQTALEGVDYENFEYGHYRERARRRARQLIDDFYRALYENSPFVTNVRALSNELSALARERWNDFDETDRLRGIVDTIDRVDRSLSEPNLYWAFRDRFDLGHEFTRLKALAGETTFLTSEFAASSLTREMQQHGEARWRKLRSELANFNGSGLTGPLFKRNQDGVVMQLSPDVEVLQTSLKGFLSESFMSTGERFERPSLSTDVDLVRNRLRWDNNLLTYAVGVYDPYQRFTNTGLTYFPPHLQSTLKIVAQKRLNQTLVDLIQRSLILEPLPAGLTASLRARELKEEVGRFRESAPTLTRLLAILQEAQLWDLERSLSDLVAAQAYGLLTTVDRSLRTEPIYRPKGGNFDWWDVQSPLAQEAFAAKDSEELRAYLARQRARMSVLANEMAQPLVAMLANVGNDEHRELLLKWDAILNALDGYEEKQPGNSVASLEELLAVEFAQVGLENCFETARPFTQASTTGDFFRDQEYYLRDHLYQRCFAVVGQRAAEGYDRVRRFFNQRLAGKFPFAREVNNIFPVEADPETLKEFFRLFDKEKDIILGVPASSTAFRSAGLRIHEFIRDLEKIHGFLSPFLLETEPGAVPVIDCEVEFRVNRQNETAGDQIIEWKLDIGERQLIHPDPDPMVRWTLGDPVRLTLRWAQGSPWSPAETQTAGQTDVGKKTVTFDYQNKWSLISFLQRHPSVATDFFSLEDEKPHTLKFELKTGATEASIGGVGTGLVSSEAKVFIRVSLIAADTKEPLRLPSFPDKAPLLGQRAAKG